MPLSSGVTGVIHTLGQTVCTAHAGGDRSHLILGQLRCLVQKYYVVLLSLQAVEIGVPCAVRK